MLSLVLQPCHDLVLDCGWHRGSLVVLLFVRSVGDRVEKTLSCHHRTKSVLGDADYPAPVDFRVLPVYFDSMAYAMGTADRNHDGFCRLL